MRNGNIQGRRFGRLVAIRRTKFGSPSYWLCKCDCGNTKEIVLDSLKSGKTRSCGCLQREAPSKRFRKHGMSGTRIYSLWCSMRARCESPNDRVYKWYGARGIKVCQRWQKFENFLADMGERPKGMTLDRINNDGDYEPKNCRWATYHQQMMNKSNNARVVWEGKKQLLANVCAKFGLDMQLVRDRMKLNWPLREALTIPKLSLTSQRSKQPYLRMRKQKAKSERATA